MVKVYILEVSKINNTEIIAGQDLIHDGLLLTTEDPTTRKLIMDTTADEHQNLTLIAISYRDPTQEEIDLHNSQVIINPPDPDTLRAHELLVTSPPVITLPEIWELLRIIGRRLGYISDQ